ncbi:unnamed protein product [Callosobruchus maculatus]|uniref:Uncharacterized protein n=1 Tax=Callosobruchus maculatus TaxID=64391 RepID=A0A653C040_CALMS|nr:unnamed protein product [Callosobruchus maculatus]
MVTPYFSKLCHGHTWLLNAPYPNCRSKNRATQNFELLHTYYTYYQNSMQHLN